MKKIFLLVLISICMLGCATSEQTKNAEPLSTHDIIDPYSSHEVLWLIVQQDSYGLPLQLWVTNTKIYFLKSGGIYFLDEYEKGVILYRNYSFTIIKVGDWTHPDFRIEEIRGMKERLEGKEEPPKKAIPKKQKGNEIIAKKIQKIS